MKIFAISALINCVVAIGFAVFVISRNWRIKSNRLYFLLGCSVSFWSFGYWQWQLSSNYSSALFWVRILSIGSTMIPVFYFHWITIILERDEKEKKVILFAYILAFIILLFSFSQLFIKDVRPKMTFPFWPDPGVLYHFYLAYVYCILVAYSIFLLIRDFFRSVGEKKAQIIYVLIGSIVGFGGGIFNFFLWYDIPILPYGNFLVVLYPFFLGYALLKYHLFEVKVVTTETLTFIIWIILFIRTALSTNIQDIIINLSLLIALVFAGIFLIRSILKEIRQREQMEKMAWDIRRAYETEKKAKEELQRLDEAKTQFTMATQHHLRTPLTSMRGYIDLIMSGTYGKIPDRLKEPLLKFEISTKRLIKIVNEFLDISQFQLGKQVVSLKPGIKIEPIINEIIEELKFEVESKKLYLILEKPENLYAIKADEEKLKVALFNLIDNAVKYTQKGGVRITITDGETIEIKIKDTGIGIAKEDIEKIFGRTFERGKEAKRVFTTGRGIGLYITGEIVKAHHGRVWVESDGVGMGSTFHVELPVG